MDVDALSHRIIGAAIEVHRHLGPGLLESAYRICLSRELQYGGFDVKTEVPVTVRYKGVVITEAYRMDMLVEDSVVVELKAVDKIHERHKAQLLTYLRLTGKRLGLLINFNETALRHGIRRVVHQLTQ
ncbi:MAG TPA: GxxExxY protein [Thiotrichales bacterium]|nr:GxxExxY protein [Thiotrichales bacterium]